MKKSQYFLIILATFVGVLLAFQVDRYFRTRAVYTGPNLLTEPRIIPASYDTEAGASQPQPVDFRMAAKKASASVVSVDQLRRLGRSWDDDTGQMTKTGSGSGVIISADGVIVTNNHVVAGAEQVRVRLSDGRTLPAQVVGTDRRSDLAVLRVKADNLKPMALGDSARLEVGQWVIAIGNPLGFDNTVSVGVVSSLNRSLSIQGSPLIDGIQTDAAINPGNSGGALTNAEGELIGINSAIASNNSGSIGIGFAIPVNRVKQVTNDILKLGHARYAGLGVSYEARLEGILGSAEGRAQLAELRGGTPPSRGILISAVEPGSPAAEAGMERFDVLLEVDGKPVDDSVSLNKILNYKRPGERCSVKFWSRGKVKTVNLTLKELSG